MGAGTGQVTARAKRGTIGPDCSFICLNFTKSLSHILLIITGLSLSYILSSRISMVVWYSSSKFDIM